MFCRHELGQSAAAIAGSGTNHPWDPADLLRCMNYCRDHFIPIDKLRKKMAGRSAAWDLLLSEWENLTALLQHEMDTHTDGRAPLTYKAMQRVLADGIGCDDCNSTGRGTECLKCKGTGKRGGGKCRAQNCSDGAAYCPSCRGYGYTKK